MELKLNDVSKILKQNNNFYILTHKTPDGDTLGSAFALCFALQKINKNAKVLCSDEIPEKYSFLYDKIKKQDFEPKYIISVDVADKQLLGNNLSYFENKIDLCIDHHICLPNNHFAKFCYIESNSAATAEIIYYLIKILNIDFDVNIANCIYTGISTDTGCFRHSNATARSYKIAAKMIDLGVNAYEINKIMFDTKSKSKLNVERIALDSIEFFFDDKCAVISITNEDITKTGAHESDFDGISAIPRQIEKVLVGVFIKEKEPGIFKVSVRTDESIDASKICMSFNGGGHKCAAGCTILGNLSEVKKRIVSVVKKYIN